MPLLVAIAGLVAGLVGLGIDAWLIFPSVMTVSAENLAARSLPDAFIYFWTFFTHLTNLGLLLAYAAGQTGAPWLGWFRKPQAQTLLAGYIVLVMAFYHFMLAPTLKMEGALAFATLLLHYVTPLLYLAWWAIGTRHGRLRFTDLPGMLVPGLLYVGWVLVRGLVIGEYPYEILDPTLKLPDGGVYGYTGVAIGVGIIVGAVAVFCALLIFADRLLARRQPA